jgi:OPA family sugar phosphate sensor protein UhpC-like MFS transporter
VVATMYLGYAMFMVLRMIPTVAGGAMREDSELGIDLAVWGRILAMGTVGGVVGKFVGGYAADRFGGKITFTISLLVASIFVGLFALSSAVWAFQFTFFVALLAKSAGWPSMAKIILNWFRPSEYGRVWGVLSTSSRIGTLVATFLLGGLLAYLSWRLMLTLAAGAGVVTVVIFAFFLKERPAGKAATLGEDIADAIPKETSPHPLDGTTLPQAVTVFLKSRQFWLITASLMGLTILWDFLLFVPMYLEDTLNLSVADASKAASAFPFGSLISVVVGGYFFDRLSRRSMAWVMGSLLALTAGCIAVFFMMPQFDLTQEALTSLSLGLLFLFGFCVSPCYYIPMSVFSIEFGGPHSGFLIALLDALAFASNAVFYYYAGEIAQEGWNIFLLVLMAVAIWSLLTTFLFLAGEARRSKRGLI